MVMKMKTFALVPLALIVFFFASSAQAATSELVPKIENFVLFLDHSGSMAMSMEGQKTNKISAAVNILSRMNDKIPALPYQAGLATFAPYKLRSGMGSFDRASMASAIQGVETKYEIFGRRTPMGDSLALLAPIVSGLNGRTAIILVSDGESNQGSEPVAQAKKIYDLAPGRICFHVIDMGGTETDQASLEAIANLNSCCSYTTAAFLRDDAGMDAFVHGVFYDVIGDSDGDGVLDNRDKCPNTPRGTPVDADGCPLPPKIVDVDSDGDGVVDRLDKCPGTPLGLAVDEHGCPIEVTFRLEIQFDSDKAVVKPIYDDQLQAVADFLKANPETAVTIEGHTDSTGSKASNKKLSQARAVSVKNALVDRMGIDPARLTAMGFGQDRPIATNETVEGRQQNRRVQAVFSGFKKK
ncbi:MAG: hypothetical protein EOM25_02340 [Deltaproteobacteria bacterium]|nr:hypothetical protein [Deltaproteobacteria bacterium]